PMLLTVSQRLVSGRALAWCGLLCGCLHPLETPALVPIVPAYAVGHVAAERFTTPTGQVLTPAGAQIPLPGMRPQAIALRSDGKLLAVAGSTDSLLLLDPDSGEVL